jgi:hypothetical protein
VLLAKPVNLKTLSAKISVLELIVLILPTVAGRVSAYQTLVFIQVVKMAVFVMV